MSETKTEYRTMEYREQPEVNFNDYQLLARYTANKDRPVNERIINWALGLAGEAGEVADMIKKVEFHGHELDHEELYKELGDILWYVANLAYEFDEWLEDIADRNIKKLAKRYPEGFSKERSVNRSE